MGRNPAPRPGPGGGHRVGYQAAVLAELTDQVFSIELLPELARQAAARLEALGYGRIRVRSGDGYEGWPEAAPLTPSWSPPPRPGCPRPWQAQLKEGGRLVIPLGAPYGGQTLVRYRKAQGKLAEEAALPVRFVPLVRPPALKASPGEELPPAGAGPR